MASPFQVFLVPNCGLEISCDISEHTYIIEDKSKHAFQLENDSYKFEDIWKGKMSPFSEITLPPAIKLKAGIPPKARRFAFLYPPNRLADRLDWDFHDNNIEAEYNDMRVNFSKDARVERNWAAPFFSTMGGFVYIDENNKLLTVNALSMIATPRTIKFSGPFETNDEIVRSLESENRIETIAIDIFHEVGIVEFAWVLPNECFQGRKDLIDQNIHGAFVFIREDNSAVTYIVTPQITVKPQGSFDIVNDVFYTFTEQLWLSTDKNMRRLPSSKFVKDPHSLACRKPRMKKDIGEKFKDFMDILENPDYGFNNRFDEEDEMTKGWGYNRNIFHVACSFGTTEQITSLIGLIENASILLTRRDDFQWTPLYYLCRYNSDKDKALETLLRCSPKTALSCDGYCRYPLHVACDSKPSVKFVEMLLTQEKLLRENQISTIFRKKTKHLKLLPLHIACLRTASKGVIELLLKEDNFNFELFQKRTIHMTSGIGRNVLSIAIENKLPANIIELLLQAEGNTSENIGSSFRGMQPIHIACWKSYCDKVVLKLLQCDKDGDQVKTSMTEKLTTYLGLDDVLQMSTTSLETSKLIVMSERHIGANQSARQSYESLPIHLALYRNATHICEHLLQEEEKNDSFSSLDKKDSDGRYPLHIACLKNAEERIIRRVFKENLCGPDKYGLRPLHYASDHKDAQINIVKMIIDGESKRHHLDYERKHSPLLEAVKAEAPCSVIEALLHPKYFNLKGFTEALIKDLSLRVKESSRLQMAVTIKLSNRLSFMFLITDIISKIISFVCVLIWSEMHIIATKSNDLTRYVTRVLALVMGCCTFYELAREFIQLFSQGIEYFLKPTKFLELPTWICLLMSWIVLQKRREEMQLLELESILLQVTAGLLVTVILTSVRATFLPFAKFVGGICSILQKLLPFFMVSVLVIFLFTYLYRMSTKLEGSLKNKDVNDLTEVEKYCGMNENFGDCFNFVSFGFFHGFDSPNGSVDFLFGVLAIVILLTVLIAIVSDAWTKSQKMATEVFWEGRLSFISEIRSLDIFLTKFEPKWLKELKDKVDTTDSFNFSITRKNIHWTKETPYNEVVCYDQYLNPKYNFEPDKAKKILGTHSIRSDLYWINYENKRENNRIKYYKRLMVSIGKRCMNALFKILLILAGCITAGFLWPHYFRTWILSFGVDGDDDQCEEENVVDMKQDEKCKDILTRITKLEKELIKRKAMQQSHISSQLNNVGSDMSMYVIDLDAIDFGQSNSSRTY